MTELLHELVLRRAERSAADEALRCKGQSLSYAAFSAAIDAFARALAAEGIARQERVAIYLPKQLEAAVAIFGTSAAGCIFVPVNPVLKPLQVGHILRDCNVRVLVTSRDRAATLTGELADCGDLRTLVLVDRPAADGSAGSAQRICTWQDFLSAAGDSARAHRVIDTDVASILYTSGSTGRPKGVVLSHRNMVSGAHSVASYLANEASDRILAVLPLSFDAGFSQLTTAFASGACAVLMDYLLPRDVLRTLSKERITGLTAVPPLWIQLAALDWPQPIGERLRYVANTGGAMPRATLAALRQRLPRTRVFLMYGLTEAFRSTYLPPEEIDRRPGSIGKAIPNAEILVVRPDGTACDAEEPGELVHRGSLVALGYWNDPQRTAERFRPAPGQLAGLVNPELAVWSGDTVRRDAEGFLYFVGRRDEMIKTSGYRVSPSEVEEVVHASGEVGDVVALGLPHPLLGQGIVVVASARRPGAGPSEAVLEHCRNLLPNFMVPLSIIWREDLPRNPNGKFDRRRIAEELQNLFEDASID